MYSAEVIKKLTAQQDIIQFLQLELDVSNRINKTIEIANESIGEMLVELSLYKEKYGETDKHKESLSRIKNIMMALSETTMIHGKNELLMFKMRKLHNENRLLKQAVAKLNEQLTREETLSKLI